MEELLSLKWNNHRSTFLHILTILRKKQLYTDVTLACNERFYSAHKLVLSTCSDYFSAIFDRTTCKNPTVVLKDIKCEDLEALLDYMYLGEVNVRQADLASLIKAAECLRVKGLAVPDDEPPKKGGRIDSRRPDGLSSPPAKRKRRDELQDGRDDVRPGRLSPSTLRQKSSQSPRLSPLLEGESGHLSPSAPDGNENATSPTSPFVKVEREENNEGDLDNYSLTNDGFKEEPDNDPGGDLSNDLPEFLQTSGTGSYSHSFAGPSFQSDMQNWQGDQVLSGNYSGLGFQSSTSQESPQNTSSGIKSNCVGVLSSLVSTTNVDPLQLIPSDPFDAANRLLESGPRRRSLFDPRDVRTVSCLLCRKVFHGKARKQSLERHMRIHTGEKPFQCPFCFKRMKLKHHVTNHVRAMHLKHLQP